ncbi:hypothetical protein [Agromyces ramosus]|uniref:NUDIX domain-containing protein n=1 Tax=Agromyces ramosus TaxID=33879 RepID=A0ABU0R6N4_9MICO|nr:hypothetical protein [Agromyces ramosus]MDQ0893751.1 hypothetical protein [Agromyces ramosus]
MIAEATGGSHPDHRGYPPRSAREHGFFFAWRRWSGTPALPEHTASDLRWFELDAMPDDVVHHERLVIERLRDGALEPITSFGF